MGMARETGEGRKREEVRVVHRGCVEDAGAGLQSLHLMGGKGQARPGSSLRENVYSIGCLVVGIVVGKTETKATATKRSRFMFGEGK